MDYEVLVLFADGYFETIPCATQTDVENTVVQVARRADGIRAKMVNINIINKTV